MSRAKLKNFFQAEPPCIALGSAKNCQFGKSPGFSKKAEIVFNKLAEEWDMEKLWTSYKKKHPKEKMKDIKNLPIELLDETPITFKQLFSKTIIPKQYRKEK